jgi:uncharacterized membrane protein YccC
MAVWTRLKAGFEKRSRRSIAPNCLRTSFNPFENQEFKGERVSRVWRATMADVKRWTWLKRGDLEHAARTAVAAGAPLLIARLLRMPEGYWATIISLIVTQSALGATWTISKQRLAGCAIGVTTGGLLADISGAEHGRV